jgi:hypothetical protein
VTGLPPRLLARVVTPPVFAGLTAAFTWTYLDGPAGPWRLVLLIAIPAVAVLTALAIVWFTWDIGFIAGAVPAGLVGLVMVSSIVLVVSNELYVERGHDVACRVTAVTVDDHTDVVWHRYTFACDGRDPVTLDYTTVPEDLVQGQRISLRFDPTDGHPPDLSRDVGTEGRIALIIAVISVVVLMLIAAFTAWAGWPEQREREQPNQPV